MAAKRMGILAILFACMACLPPAAWSAFYKYIDENGHAVYVDDVSKAPPEQAAALQKYEEPADSLTPEQLEALEAEKQQQRQDRQDRKEALELEKRRREYEARILQHERIFQEKQAAAKGGRTTRIRVENGAVFVPVTFRNKGSSVTAELILDTGANMTLIHASVADRLNLGPGRKVSLEVVGGALIPAKHTTIDAVEVGPHVLENKGIVVIEGKDGSSHQGLLGLDILGAVHFSVDMENQLIRWKD